MIVVNRNHRSLHLTKKKNTKHIYEKSLKEKHKKGDYKKISVSVPNIIDKFYNRNQRLSGKTF